jgi:hypothetical protein
MMALSRGFERILPVERAKEPQTKESQLFTDHEILNRSVSEEESLAHASSNSVT